MPYDKFQKSHAPPWLKNPHGSAWLGSLGQAKDTLVDQVRQAVKLRFPTLCPSDALAALGGERQIDRGPSDTDAVFATRVLQAWDVWPFAGSGYGILSALAGAGFSTPILAQENGWLLSLSAGSLVIADAGLNPNIAGSPPWMSFDASGLDAEGNQFASRFVVIFPSSTPTTNQIATVKSIIGRWKPAKAVCVGITALVTGRLWGYPVAKWGSAGAWGGTSVFFSYP